MAKKNVFKSIGAFINKVLFGGKFNSFAKASENLLKQNLGPIAIKAVTDAQTLGLSGNAARDHAVAQVKADGKDLLSQATASGLQIKDSFVILITELALQKVQGTLNSNTK